MDWAFVMSVVCTGILVVFIALIVLIIIVQATGKIFQILDEKSKKNEIQVTVAPKAAPTVIAVPVSPAKSVTTDGGITDEIVAAISAAISCVMMADGNNKPFVIKSIKQSTAGRNAWNMAGISDNTRPF